MILALPLALALPLFGDPEEAADAFLADIVEYVDGDSAPDAAERWLDVYEHLDGEMRKALSPRKLRAIVDDLRAPEEATLESVYAREDALGGGRYIAQLVQGEARWLVDASITKRGQVDGLWFKPVPPRLEREALEERTLALAHDWAFVGLKLDADGGEVERIELGSGRELFPLGSVFKVYVLAELARQAAAGEVKLSARFKIEDGKKSLPSGVMHELKAGKRIKILHAAEQMIEISDNTATDHLLFLVGRENVEAHLGEYGNSAVARNTPFLATREMFLLKGLGTTRRAELFEDGALESVVAAWLAADAEQRRAWLTALAAHVAGWTPGELRGRLSGLYGIETAGTPSHVEIEWLARPGDVPALLARALRGELVDEETSELFLSIYAAGTPQVPDPVRYQGFKGGSETNLFALSAAATANDGHHAIVFLARCGFPASEADAIPLGAGLAQGWLRHLLEP